MYQGGNMNNIKSNTLIYGDSLELMHKVKDKSIDLIFTDLPYGTTKNDWDNILPFDEMWSHYERIIKDDGVILLFAQAPFDKVLACSNLELFRYEWIWEKTSATGFLNAQKMPLKAHENILVFYKKLPTYNPIKTKGHMKVSATAHQSKCAKSSNYGKQMRTKDYSSDERYPRSVLKFKTDKQGGALHPTQKPLELIKYMIKTYTNEGDVVLDNCMGSGTTIVGAIQTNRKYIGMEITKKFYSIARDRVDEALGYCGLFKNDDKKTKEAV